MSEAISLSLARIPIDGSFGVAGKTLSTIKPVITGGTNAIKVVKRERNIQTIITGS